MNANAANEIIILEAGFYIFNIIAVSQYIVVRKTDLNFARKIGRDVVCQAKQFF